MFDFVLNMPLVTTIFSFKKKLKGKINSVLKYYSNELKKSSDTKKKEAGLDDINKLKWDHFFESNLIILPQINLTA